MTDGSDYQVIFNVRNQLKEKALTRFIILKHLNKGKKKANLKKRK